MRKSITIITMPLAYTLNGFDSRNCRHRSKVTINSNHCEHHLPSPGCHFAAPRSPFLSRSFCNWLAELKTPFVPDPQAAQLGSLLYLFNAQGSQK